MESGRILVVDDDKDILTASKLLLERQFDQVVTSSEPETINELMQQQQFDVILLDMNFGPGESSGDQGLHWLKQIITIDPEAVVVMITAHGSLRHAVETIKLGATDFIVKPWQNEKLGHGVCGYKTAQ